MSRNVMKIACAVSCFSAAAVAQELPLRDPMRPYAAPAGFVTEGSVARAFELSAVFISETRRIAVINGALLREGDRIGNAQITRIDPQSVRLRRGGEDLVVHLNGEGTRRSDNDGDPAS